MEFIKNDCAKKLNGTICSFCILYPWVGPPCSRVPCPMPDYDKLPDFHYKNVWETPGSINGKQRTIDDFQPRRQLQNLFEMQFR